MGMFGGRLRFGVLCDGDLVEAWQIKAIERIEATGVAECVAILLPAESPGQRPRRRRIPNRNSLFNLFQRLVSRRCGAMARFPIAAGRSGVRTLRLETVPGAKGRTRLSPAALAEFEGLDLDFAVKFGFGILSGEALDVPRHGVWSYHHGDPAQFRGQPPGLWEIVQRAPTTGAIVQRLNETLDGGDILARMSIRTNDRSYARQLDRLLDESATLMAQVAHHCAVRGALPRLAAERLGPIYRKPANGTMVGLLLRMALNRLGAPLRALFRHQHWAIVASRVSFERIVGGGFGVPLDRYLAGAWPMPEEKGFFAADPFFLHTDASDQQDRDEGLILFERFDWETGLGHIAAGKVDAAGRYSAPIRLLDPGSHLSYPFVYTRDDRATIIPEAVAGGRLIEYEHEAGSRQLNAIRDLGEAVLDPTILYHDGRYWMFYCGDGDNSHLCIRYAETEHGPWTEHVQNPVKIDVGNARPAGSFVTLNGEIYRPAQICAPSYGQGIVINRVIRLDEAGYEEEPVASILPATSGPYRGGVHTISRAGELILLDHARYIFSVHEAARQIGQRLRKLLVQDRAGTPLA